MVRVGSALVRPNPKHASHPSGPTIRTCAIPPILAAVSVGRAVLAQAQQVAPREVVQPRLYVVSKRVHNVRGITANFQADAPRQGLTPRELVGSREQGGCHRARLGRLCKWRESKRGRGR